MTRAETFDCQLVNGRFSEEQREQFYTKMKPTVVNVEIWVQGKEYDCEGGGVFISPQGHVLTLFHMLLREGKLIDKLQVITNEGETYKASIMSADATVNLAILELSDPKLKKLKIRFPFAQICTDELKIGEQIYPIGHPGYLDFSFPIGHISFPCREYDELNKSLTEDYVSLDLLGKRLESELDNSARYICFTELSSLQGLSSSVCFVMVNNVHGDGRGGASGMPFFNSRGHIIGMYHFLAYDQCFGIHAKTLHSYAMTSCSHKITQAYAVTSNI